MRPKRLIATITAGVALLLCVPAAGMAQGTTSGTDNAAGGEYQKDTGGTVPIGPTQPPPGTLAPAAEPVVITSVPSLAPGVAPSEAPATAPPSGQPPAGPSKAPSTGPARTIPIANPPAAQPAAQPAVAPAAASTSGSLPFTGYDAWLTLLIGVGVLALAVVLRRFTRAS